MDDSPTPSEITRMFTAWRDGDPEALASLTPLVYRELRNLAASYLSAERPGHILQPSALVNEAFLRLMEWQPQQWQNLAHFFGVCTTMMRRIQILAINQRNGITSLPFRSLAAPCLM